MPRPKPGDDLTGAKARSKVTMEQGIEKVENTGEPDGLELGLTQRDIEMFRFIHEQRYA